MTADEYKNSVAKNCLDIPGYGKVLELENVFNIIDLLCAGENDVLHDVSKMLPTDEQIGKIVHKIAYTQQGEEQGEDFIQKVWILKNFIEKQFNAETIKNLLICIGYTHT